MIIFLIFKGHIGFAEKVYSASDTSPQNEGVCQYNKIFLQQRTKTLWPEIMLRPI
jgi:hypothetical protein